MSADRRFDSTTTTTTCGYCGVGCRLEAHARGGRIVSISPAEDGPANRGHTCLKGRFAHQYTRARDRLTAPLIRESGAFRIGSWDEALDRVAGEFLRIKAEHGADAIAGLASSRATNEDCYAMQRVFRAAIGTHNIDNCSRVCHSPTSFALRKSLGLSGCTGSFDDIEAAQVLLIVGANPTAGAPGRGARMKQAALNGTKIVTADPRRIELADYGVLHCGMRPGTNAAFLNGLAHVLIRDGLVDDEFIDARTDGFEAVVDLVADYTPEEVERITSIPAADLVEAAAHLYGEAERASIAWGLGVTEQRYGSECVQMICNLALMTGKIGKPGCALMPLRGQNNVQGSSDMGALPDTFTAYRSVGDEETARLFEERWGVQMGRERGLKMPEMLDAADRGPHQGDVDLRLRHRAVRPRRRPRRRGALEPRVPRRAGDLRERDLELRARRSFRPPPSWRSPGRSRTPSGACSSSRRQRRPPGAAKTDLEIYGLVVGAARRRASVRRARGRHGRDRRADAALRRRHLRAARAGAASSGRSPPDGTDSPILYDDALRASRRPRPLRGAPVQASGRRGERGVPAHPRHRPAARALQRRHDDPAHGQPRALLRATGSRSTRTTREELGVTSGDVVEVRSRNGRIEVEAQVTERIEPGHVFTAFHFPEVRTNLLVGPSADVNTSCPEYKVVAVSVEKTGVTAPPRREVAVA